MILNNIKWWLRKQLLRLKLYAFESYQYEAESLIIWYAVCFALGIAFYFAFPIELPVWLIIVYFEAILLLLYLYRNRDGIFKLLTYVAIFMIGLCIAKADALYRQKHIEQNLDEVIYLNGYVSDVDYNSNGKQRILLSNVNNFERDLKGDFRISLNYKQDWIKPDICIELVAKIPHKFSPNPIGNYNFDRTNFYKGISGIGYNVSPIFQKDCDIKDSFLKKKISDVRQFIKNNVITNASFDTAGVINALVIGDKSGISKKQTDNYRTAGLAHFLAISGMHMGIIALLVFFLIRATLFPIGAGRYDLRKPAAIISILFTFGYFLISGQSVSCIRAFIMTSIVLLGVLFNRRAISLRVWAFALIIVVAINPEAVVSPGFLMSFSAVLGLVSFYEKNANKIHNWLKTKSFIGKLCAYLLGVIITDLVASLMTLPYSLYYFKQISVYTSLGNLLAGPVIAFGIMPLLLLYMISLPFGLGLYTIRPLSWCVNIINHITELVSSLSGAKIGEQMGIMPDWGIFVLTLGLLWLCIWQERWRFWGILGIVVGLMSYLFVSNPDFVFDEKGLTFAYKDNDGKLSPTPFRKNKFLELMWTGNKTKGKVYPPSEDDIICNKDSCLFKNRIKFGKGFVEFDNKNIDLKSGGYINLDKGVYYYPPEVGRLWNK